MDKYPFVNMRLSNVTAILVNYHIFLISCLSIIQSLMHCHYLNTVLLLHFFERSFLDPQECIEQYVVYAIVKVQYRYYTLWVLLTNYKVTRCPSLLKTAGTTSHKLSLTEMCGKLAYISKRLVNFYYLMILYL